jgi:transposase
MRPHVEEFDAEDNEEIVERVAAIDVAKASGTVCTRVPHASIPKRRVTRVWGVPATTNAILTLADELIAAGVERVVVESTSDYWRAFVYLFESAGLTTWLVNAHDVKQVPGRPKTDRVDAVWLAKLNERGMLRPSFIPPGEIRRLRDYTRLRSDLTEERSRHKQRVEKLLEDALIKLSTVATDIFGVSGRAMMDALIDGERDAVTLAKLAKGRLRPKHPELVQALNGRFDDHHAELARVLLDQVDSLTAKIDVLTSRIDDLIAKIPAAALPTTATPITDNPQDPASPSDPATPLPAIARLDEIPGVGLRAAQTIIAEIGLDMRQFPTANHLVSWAKLSPRTIQSGPKSRGGKTGKGNRYLKAVLGEVAVAAAKTDTFLGARYRRLVRRSGKQKALVAVARSILVVVWHLLNDPTARFNDLGSKYYDEHFNNDRKTRQLVQQLRALGHDVALTPAA